MLQNRRRVAGLVGMLLLTATSVIAAENRPPERWAVLIGVDQYSYAKSLQYCGADMRSLKSELLHAGFDERQVVLLDDKAKDSKLLPIRSSIKKQIELTCANAEQGDFVLIAFSGHGVLLGKTSYLCPTDAKIDDVETLISLDWVYDQLQKSQADLRLVLVDACRNVPIELNQKRSASEVERKENTRAFVKQAERLPEGVLLLNSCSEGEFAAEDKEFGHGVFMHFLLEGIRGKADRDRNKSVTLNELISYTSKETKLHVGAKYGDSQRPKLKGNLTGDVLDFPVAVVSLSRPGPPAPDSSPSTDSNTDTVITSRSTGMKLTRIPAGQFLMGAPPLEPEHEVGEVPQGSVEITRPFYMGVYEVTQNEFEKVMRNNPSYFSPTGDGATQVVGLDTPRFPVERVSWYDAIDFCIKLSELDGLSPRYGIKNIQREGAHSIKYAEVSTAIGDGYRLPTEAEWEYACRARTTSPFHFGTVFNGDESNADGRYPYGTKTQGKYLARTTTAGTYQSNSFGLHDVHGNVYEWCFDKYEDVAYYLRKGPSKDPVVTSTRLDTLLGSAARSERVLRGGAWNTSAKDARSASRSRFSPDSRHPNIGFRVVR